MSRVAVSVRDARIDRLREVVGTFLGVDAGVMDVRTPLTAYGLDSLSALELVATLEDAFSCALPEWLLAESPDLESLADALDGEHDSGRCDTEHELQLALDAVLPHDIVPDRPFVPETPERRILLTGATGFLGAWLLHTLIHESSAEIVCLARAASAPARDRVRQNLERYGLWSAEAATRVQVVEGDLTAPALGLAPHVYRELAETIDVIHHAAADVSWVSPYAALRQANVTGTMELLRLACAVRTKPFQFVSSLSVCYAVGGPDEVFETADMLGRAGALPLGYAQSKCVAEALVREAAARGLPATIVRPALIGGDSTTGASNLDDLTSVLLRGCVEMGAAPDLDWTFDAVPADTAARAIVSFAKMPAPGLRTFHLSHPRPRHWRECVLWANLFGYPIRLEPYALWLDRLRRESTHHDHPLHRLRAFFFRRVAGQTTPEHFEAHARSRVDCSHARRVERDRGVEYPPLDAALLNRYFDYYVGCGHLPPPVGRDARAASLAKRWTWESSDYLERVLRAHFEDEAIRVTSLDLMTHGSDYSIVGELTSWRRGARTGLFHYRVGLEDRSGARSLDVMVKAKPSDEDVIEVAETIAAMCDPRVSAALGPVRGEIGVRGSHVREVELYASSDTSLRRHMARCYATWQRDDEASWGIVLERLTDMAVIDSAESLEAWTDEAVDATIAGLAEIHAPWLGRESELERQPWMGHVSTSQRVGRLVPFWRALADHAAPRFEQWAGKALVRTHAELVGTVPTWWPAFEALPRTLIHNDFNPRNIALRRSGSGLRLVAYDWELATIGAPTRDLAELLCFVLPDDVCASRLARLVDDHRCGLERASGMRLEASRWAASFASALADVLVSRLSFYVLVDRVRPQPFLPRIVRTWARLHAMVQGCVAL